MTIEVLVAPSLRLSWMKMVAYLKRAKYDRLFLNFSRNLEHLVTELSEGRLAFEDFSEKIVEEKLVPEPVGSWMYTAEPVLKSLKKLKAKSKIHCYRDVQYDQLSARIAGDMAALTLQTSLTENVKVEKWKSLVIERIERKSGALRVEADFIHERASQYSLCVSGFDGKSLKQRLIENEEEVNLTNIEQFYYPTPLET
jgi:hypothetical protein